MRTGTVLVLLGFILLFAVFGWQVFGILALSALVMVLLAVGAAAVALWVVKRRMERRLRELGLAVEQRLRDQQAAGARGDAIDVEGTVRKPRDGADEPDEP